MITAITCFYLVTRKPSRYVCLCYPALIIFSIVATGDHFWIDAILGADCCCRAELRLGDFERYHPTLPDSARLRLHLQPVGR